MQLCLATFRLKGISSKFIDYVINFLWVGVSFAVNYWGVINECKQTARESALGTLRAGTIRLIYFTMKITCHPLLRRHFLSGLLLTAKSFFPPLGDFPIQLMYVTFVSAKKAIFLKIFWSIFQDITGLFFFNWNILGNWHQNLLTLTDT
jgi:hypothetical protein